MTRSSHRRPASQPSDISVFVGLLILLAWIPLPLGSNREVFSALLACSAALLLIARLGLGLIRGLPLPPRNALFGAALLSWCGWLAWIWAPLLFNVTGCGPMQTAPPSFRAPCTIDPAATWEATLLSSAYFCIYLVAAMVVRGRMRTKMLMLTFAISGGLQAIYAVLGAFAAGSEPGSLSSIASGSFVNRNHLAGYLIICIPAALAAILADTRGGRLRDRWDWLRATLDLLLSRRLVIRAGLLFMMIALVMTQSRLGNLGALTALLGTGLLYTGFHHRQRLLPIALLFASLVIVDLIIVDRWYGLDRVIERVENTEISQDTRALIWRDSQVLVRQYGQSGSGLGTFERAFEPVRGPDIQRRIDHAHNAYLEFRIETGWIGVLLLSALVLPHLLQLLRICRSRRRNVAAFGFFGLAALAGTLIQAVGEFGLQIPAIAASFIVILGASFGLQSGSGNEPVKALD